MVIINSKHNYQLDDVNLAKVKESWDISEKSLATNVGKQNKGEWKKNVPYYAVTINGESFPGERPFEDRWNLLNNIYNFKGRKVLECGTNMGLFASFLLKIGGAAAVTGFEREEVIHDASKLFAEGLGVLPRMLLLNINNESKNWEETLGFEYDVVLVLSVFKYFKNKDRVLRYYSYFPTLIFEGELGEDDLNLERFGAMGFRGHKVGVSERKRSVFLFEK